MTHTHCKTCGVELRPARQSEATAPGTKPHFGGGDCSICYKASRYVPTGTDRPKGHRPTLAALLAERDKFAAARHARGVPKEGLRGTRDRIPA